VIAISYPQLGAEVFTAAAGTYDADQSISIRSSTMINSGEVVYYTVDGSTPTTSSPQLTTGQYIGIYGPGSTTVTAFSTHAGYVPSGITSAIYNITYPTTGKMETLAGISPAATAIAKAASGPVYGTANGQGTVARFHGPQGVVADGSGNVYVADTGNNLIRKIDSTGLVTTLAGGGGAALIGTADGTGTGATFNSPAGIAIDSTNTYLVVADYYFHAIRKIVISSGAVTTLNSNLGLPTGVSVDPTGNVYVADPNFQGILKVAASDGSLSLVAGKMGSTYVNGVGATVTSAGYVDATGYNAFFNNPSGLAFVADATNGDYLLVADRVNNKIRKVIISSGAVTTFAGGGASPQYGYGTAAVASGSAQFSNPCGIALDSTGTSVYVADTYNNMVRKIVLATGQTSVVAGLYSSGYRSGGLDGAYLYQPFGVAVDSSGKIYVGDMLNSAIRVVTP
jgi:DNA-binding beta-propeller fold protein YncE